MADEQGMKTPNPPDEVQQCLATDQTFWKDMMSSSRGKGWVGDCRKDSEVRQGKIWGFLLILPVVLIAKDTWFGHDVI